MTLDVTIPGLDEIASGVKTWTLPYLEVPELVPQCHSDMEPVTCPLMDHFIKGIGEIYEDDINLFIAAHVIFGLDLALLKLVVFNQGHISLKP